MHNRYIGAKLKQAVKYVAWDTDASGMPMVELGDLLGLCALREIDLGTPCK